MSAARKGAIPNAKFTSPNFAQLAIIADGIGSAASAPGIHHRSFFRGHFHWMAYPRFRYRTMNAARIRAAPHFVPRSHAEINRTITPAIPTNVKLRPEFQMLMINFPYFPASCLLADHVCTSIMSTASCSYLDLN